MKKRLQSILLMILLTSFTSYGQNVGGKFYVGDLQYEIRSTTPDKKVAIIGFVETATEVTIPQTVNHDGSDYMVTSIEKEAFFIYYHDVAQRGPVTKLTFDTPSNVTSIGEDAFFNNQLDTLVIPESVTSLGQRAFGINNLAKVTIPNSINSIPKWAFSSNKLSEVTIPASVNSIGEQAFHGNFHLDLVTLEDSDPPTIHEKAFTSTAFLDGNRHDITLIVPKGAIGAYKDPVNGWTGFKLYTSGIFTDDGIKYGIISLTEVRIMDYSGSAEAVEIPETIKYDNETYTVTTIGHSAFRKKGLTKVSIPNTVTRIEGWAFAENQLTEVSISSSVTSIEDAVFGHNRLTEVTIPDGVTHIGSQAFALNQFTEVIIPSSVTSLSSLAFDRNPALKTVLLVGTTPPSIEGDTFTDRSEIAVIVPKGSSPRDIEIVYRGSGWEGFGSITEGIGLSIVDVPSKVESLSPFDLTFQFAREVTGFTADDISLEHARLSDFAGEGSTYTAKVTPTICDGFIQVTVPDDVANHATHFLNWSATTRVAVSALPSAPEVTPSLEYCMNDTATALTASGTGLLWYTSRRDGTGDVAAPIPNTATVGETPYFVSQTDGNGCESERARIVVTVRARPEAPTISSPVEYCTGETATALAATGTNLQWYTTETEVTGTLSAPTPNTIAAGETSYFVTQTNANGCESERAKIDVIVTACGSAQILSAGSGDEVNDFTFYPNPAQDVVYVDPGSGQALKQVNIYTLTGAYLYSETELEINTSRLSKGIYLFEVVTKTGDKSMRKVVIE